MYITFYRKNIINVLIISATIVFTSGITYKKETKFLIMTLLQKGLFTPPAPPNPPTGGLLYLFLQ